MIYWTTKTMSVLLHIEKAQRLELGCAAKCHPVIFAQPAASVEDRSSREQSEIVHQAVRPASIARRGLT